VLFSFFRHDDVINLVLVAVASSGGRTRFDDPVFLDSTVHPSFTDDTWLVAPGVENSFLVEGQPYLAGSPGNCNLTNQNAPAGSSWPFVKIQFESRRNEPVIHPVDRYAIGGFSTSMWVLFSAFVVYYPVPRESLDVVVLTVAIWHVQGFSFGLENGGVGGGSKVFRMYPKHFHARLIPEKKTVFRAVYTRKFFERGMYLDR